MNPTLQNWLNQAQKFFGSLSPGRRVALSLAIIGLVGAGIGLSLMERKESYDTLYSDLVPEDFRAVTQKLGELGIAYQTSPDQTAVTVPKGAVATARMELAKEGLPGGDVVGFERFDKSTFGMSSYVQRIQYLRAVQGELTRSIQRIDAVKRARVHLSLPPKKTFLEEQETPKASVILELDNGKSLSTKEVKGIAHLVASAVESLDVNQVTIVDNRGKFLHRPSDQDADGLASGMLEIQRNIETTYEQRVVDILTPVVGVEKVIAKVTAEIDRARVNTTQESFDADRAVAVSSRTRDEVSNGSRPNPIGIPGSRANLPGSEVENPPVPMATANTEMNDRDTNFVVPRKVETINKPSGSIRRLTVAVVVDGYYGKDGRGNEVFTPRSEEELRRIQELVANTVGFDPERRDSVTVSSLPFNKTALPNPIAGTETETPQLDYWTPYLRNGIAAAILLAFLMLVVRPLLRWGSSSEIEREVSRMPRTVAELEAARRDPELLALSHAMVGPALNEPYSKRESAELRERIEKYIAETPKKGIQIIREWLSDERLAKGEE